MSLNFNHHSSTLCYFIETDFVISLEGFVVNDNDDDEEGEDNDDEEVVQKKKKRRRQ